MSFYPTRVNITKSFIMKIRTAVIANLRFIIILNHEISKSNNCFVAILKNNPQLTLSGNWVPPSPVSSKTGDATRLSPTEFVK